ncbi:hypothetical protein Ddc_21550 [Ditylenchus destructor]|nr:hypothetical protein Ddc_21550 [Ditylenchus destructor]
MKGLCLTERVIMGLLGVTLVLVLANVILNIVIVSNQSASNTASQSVSDKAAVNGSADNATCQSDCSNCQTNRGGTPAQNIQLDKSPGFRVLPFIIT